MDDLLKDFLTETNENLSVLDVELVKLEQNPNDPELLGNIFRLVHTIKGTCGFLGLPRLEALAHASENVLGKVRDGELVVNEAAVSLILESLDDIKSIMSTLEVTEKEPEGNDADLIERLNALANGAQAPAPKAVKSAKKKVAKAEPVAVELVVEEPVAEEVAPAVVDEEPEAVVEVHAAVEEVVEHAAPVIAADEPAKDRKEGKDSKESAVAAQSIRVNVDLLENLMTMVSELVLTRNQLLQILRSQKDSEFGAPLQRLSHVTTELQEGVMKTRMQPIGNAWSKLPRIVRDLSVESGKKIELQMLGAETDRKSVV